jgi:hypothetical protein
VTRYYELSAPRSDEPRKRLRLEASAWATICRLAAKLGAGGLDANFGVNGQRKVRDIIRALTWALEQPPPEDKPVVPRSDRPAALYAAEPAARAYAAEQARLHDPARIIGHDPEARAELERFLAWVKVHGLLGFDARLVPLWRH